MKKIDYKLLLNFSNGKYTYNDYLKVKQWFLNEKDDLETETKLLEQWKEYSSDEPSESMDAVFEKVHYQILLEEKSQQNKFRFWHYYRQVAAILIPIFLLSVFAYYLINPTFENKNEWVEINAPEAARIQFMLPDSSHGWLNNGAKLRYPSQFNKHREVALTGEAFFDVKHLEHSDFTVSIPDLDVRVLGTKFNVTAYSNELESTVVLKEGKVEVVGKHANFKQLIKPGEQIIYNHQNKNLLINKVDPENYIGWTQGYLIIDNIPLKEAIPKIERWYNTDIIIQDEALKNFTFKATFAGEPLEEVLKLIAMTTPVEYQIEKRNIDSNGKINKKQVRIMLKH